MTRHLDHLTSLEDGWLDGDGKAPSAMSICVAEAVCSMSAAHGLKCWCYPDPDGGVRVEWDDGPVLEASVSVDGFFKIELSAEECR